MKKLFGVMVLAAGVTAGVLATMDTPETPDVKAIENALVVGKFRVAIADRACPVEGEPGWNYLNEQCNKWVTRADYCFCATMNEEQLIGELDPEDVPDAVFKMVGVCEHLNDEGQTVQTVEWAPVGSQPPGTWTCRLIAGRILDWRISHAATRTQYQAALEAKCCADCPGDACWISNNAHRHCPRCLLPSTPGCDTYCPTPE
jgi:hypothetical protein